MKKISTHSLTGIPQPSGCCFISMTIRVTIIASSIISMINSSFRANTSSSICFYRIWENDLSSPREFIEIIVFSLSDADSSLPFLWGFLNLLFMSSCIAIKWTSSSANCLINCYSVIPSGTFISFSESPPSLKSESVEQIKSWPYELEYLLTGDFETQIDLLWAKDSSSIDIKDLSIPIALPMVSS